MAVNFYPSDETFDDFELNLTQEEIITDYRVAYRSRQVSLIGRQDVLSGRAKFGIFGDGKEIPQLAMARAFRKGDFRSGYYRDQTFMLALGEMTVESFFAQLFAHADLEADPASGGRMMNAHFATRSLDSNGAWRDLTQQYNSAADISPTAAQMPRLVGLAYASRLYRELDDLKALTQFSTNGDEVAFGTIGNASTAEGMFWETVNAIGVLSAPAVISIWDDGYGISVPNVHQVLKEDLSALLSGFQREPGGPGYDIYTVPGWDYPALMRAYSMAAANARTEHVPAILHIVELTQPQGHSTSGSHERYKSAERLEWEASHDGLRHMRQWIIAEGILSPSELDALEEEEKDAVKAQHKAAWNAFVASGRADLNQVVEAIREIGLQANLEEDTHRIIKGMQTARYPRRKDIMDGIFQALKLTRHLDTPERRRLIQWRDRAMNTYQSLYSSHLLDEKHSLTQAQAVPPVYTETSPVIKGFEILNHYFDAALARDPRVIAFGEDVGYLGGVNQSMAGMQARYGDLRVSDTGIREATILGQAIGLAMRGLRPIAEIQYLDYLLYALQLMSDDLATLRWRTVNGQQAPVIVRTRGHRLEGIWHSGSPMGGIINLVRGMLVAVPRDMVRAAGFYNTLLQSNDPGLVVEVLNGYRKKERLPDNLADMTIPFGVPETLREGRDLTLVTYGATCHIALEAADDLAEVGVQVEVIDAQTLLPFDTDHRVLASLKKTNRLLIVDEDVPGGASAYLMQQILEVQGGYHWLDSQPNTLTAKPHRPAYGTDGDYFSKPNRQDIFYAAYELMNEANPAAYPKFYAHPPTF